MINIQFTHEKNKYSCFTSFDSLINNIPNYNDILYLYCNISQLTELPKLPESLVFLSCYDNQLTSLPKLPNSLIKLYCWNNQLTSLPELPDSLIELNCENKKFFTKNKYNYLKKIIYDFYV